MCAKPGSKWRNATVVLEKREMFSYFGANFIPLEIYKRGKLFIPELIQQVHCFAIAMSTNDDMTDVINDTAQLQGSRLAAEIFVLKVMGVWYDVSGISH